jgi:DNA-binding IclR family transcriptional regulator
VKEKYYQIASLEKGVKVVELLAEKKALTVSDVAAALGFNRATSHRFLATLKDLGWVEKDDANRYRLTFRPLEIGMKVANRSEVRKEARRYMEELAGTSSETVNLGVWDGREILHVDKIDSSEILRIDAQLGSRAPAYCTALGKAVLAHLPAEELDVFLSQVRLTAHGPKTIGSRKRLRQELQKIVEQGYAVDDEELAEGLRCVAAPVFDHTGRARFALSISAPAVRLNISAVESVAGKVKDACQRLSFTLGYRP